MLDQHLGAALQLFAVLTQLRSHAVDHVLHDDDRLAEFVRHAHVIAHLLVGIGLAGRDEYHDIHRRQQHLQREPLVIVMAGRIEPRRIDQCNAAPEPEVRRAQPDLRDAFAVAGVRLFVSVVLEPLRDRAAGQRLRFRTRRVEMNRALELFAPFAHDQTIGARAHRARQQLRAEQRVDQCRLSGTGDAHQPDAECIVPPDSLAIVQPTVFVVEVVANRGVARDDGADPIDQFAKFCLCRSRAFHENPVP
nr:hypothetical protein [Burkholderia latens]